MASRRHDAHDAPSKIPCGRCHNVKIFRWATGHYYASPILLPLKPKIASEYTVLRAVP